MNLTVITNQKPIRNAEKIMRREPKHNTKEIHQTTREESKRKRKEQKRTTKSPRKNVMAINSDLSTASLNVNGLKAPIKRHRVGNCIKNKIHVYAAYNRRTSDLKTLTT